MAEAKATLELDASGLKKGASEAEQALNRVTAADAKLKKQMSGKRYDDGLDRTTKRLGDTKRAFDNLFESERKIKTNLTGLVGELSNVNSTGQAAAITINRLSETMKIGFAASIGTALGMTVNQIITDTAASLDGLTDKWQELIKFDERNAGESALVQNLQKAVSLAKQANAEAEKLSTRLIPGASAGFENVAAGAEVQRKSISTALVASAQRSAFEQELLAAGADEFVGKRGLMRQRDSAISAISSTDGLDPAQKERMIKATQAEFDAMIVQLTQKFAQATVAAVRKAEAAIAASELSQVSPLMDQREVNARRLRNQRDAANMRFMDASVNAANRPYDPIAHQELRVATAERNAANSALAMNRFMNAVDPVSGRLRSQAVRLGEVRARKVRAKNLKDSADQFSDDRGLLRVRRGSGGQVIGGIDPETGDPVGTAAAAANDLARLRSGSLNDPISVGDSFGKRSAMDWSLSLFGGGSGVSKRMEAESAAMNGTGGGKETLSSIDKSLKEIAAKLSTMLN
jgi:hypothetical protein